MGLVAQLALQKKAIVEKWFDQVVDSYPAETARFLRRHQDPFTNPVGQATLKGLNTIIDLLDAGPDQAAAKAALDPIMRIRAIQEFTPAQAVRFVFDLKHIIHAMAAADRQAIDTMTMIDRRIDELVLVAFDLYMQSREKLYELKANEVKERTYKAFARAGLIKEAADD